MAPVILADFPGAKVGLTKICTNAGTRQKQTHACGPPVDEHGPRILTCGDQSLHYGCDMGSFEGQKRISSGPFARPAKLLTVGHQAFLPFKVSEAALNVYKPHNPDAPKAKRGLQLCSG